MIAWKLVPSARLDDPLSTDGARLYGGRWNSIGTPVLYCSPTLALAALETLVHLPHRNRRPYHAVRIEVPDGRPETWAVSSLPPRWRTLPLDPACQRKGAAWIRSKRGLALLVPSMIVPQEPNLLLNPLSPDFTKVRVADTTPFPFDPRLVSLKA